MIGPVHCGCGPGSIMLKPLSWDTLYIYRYYNDDDALDKLNLPAAHLSRKSTGFVEHWELYSLQVNIIFRFSDFENFLMTLITLDFFQNLASTLTLARVLITAIRLKQAALAKGRQIADKLDGR